MRLTVTLTARLGMGTRASIRARLPPLTVVIEEGPNMADTSQAAITVIIKNRKHEYINNKI
jgi:hypothetical protein